MKYININTQKNSKETKVAKKPYKIISFTAICIIFIGLAYAVFGAELKNILNPVSIVGEIKTAKLKETDGRTNILLLGSDKRTQGTVTSVLTDTILIASIGRVDKDVVLLSLPRDLWVKTPKDYYTKVNAVYTYGGATDIKNVVEDVTGIPLHYYIVVDFELFKQTVDILGGITVDVEHAFVDHQYPVEGKENAPLSERYEVISFDKGPQVMDGETALKFARSRKGDNNEGTDFARSARQQKVIMAIKDKALSLNTILNLNKLKELYDTYNTNIDTDITFTDIQNFYLLSQQISFDKVKSFVLDDRSAADEGGLLYSPEDTSLYGGAYVLIPKTGEYSQIHAYVQRYIFGE